MIDFLKNWILNIVTLAIFIVILEILIPTGKTKKFINLVSGFILLIAIINPFIGLLNKGVDLKEFQIVDSNIIDKKEIEENSKILKEEQMQQITEVYRRKVINQIMEGAKEIEGVSDVTADVIINDDYKSNSFGEVKRVYLKLRIEDNKKGVKSVVKIDRIDIKSGEQNINQDSSKNEVSSELKKKIFTKLNKLLDVKEENLVISLQKK